MSTRWHRPSFRTKYLGGQTNQPQSRISNWCVLVGLECLILLQRRLAPKVTFLSCYVLLRKIREGKGDSRSEMDEFVDKMLTQWQKEKKQKQKNNNQKQKRTYVCLTKKQQQQKNSPKNKKNSGWELHVIYSSCTPAKDISVTVYGHPWLSG